jgi:glyoxylase-like metal-dependent hydrolase (beta-lactamase superfamily II)
MSHYRCGPYTITAPVVSTLSLDGGSMFGSVPRAVWSKKIAPDSEHRIPLVTRALLIQSSEDNRTILVDVGVGTLWDAKMRSRFALSHSFDSLAVSPDQVTDVILTHLHFDHAGGITEHDSNQQSRLTFPNATIYVQQQQIEAALSPNHKERASYLNQEITYLKSSPNLRELYGAQELFPGIYLHISNGHTRGLQWVEIRWKDEPPILFPSDIIPTQHHLPLSYHMGYDDHAALLIEEKEALLIYAKKSSATIVLQHDYQVHALNT